MIDLLLDVVEVLISGASSPDAQRHQRVARLVASITAAVVVVAMTSWSPSSTASNVALAVAGLVSAWASAFSMVDVVKEYPPALWVSVVAALVGAWVVWSVGGVLIERLALGG
jgi:hypothetical protein